MALHTLQRGKLTGQWKAAPFAQFNLTTSEMVSGWYAIPSDYVIAFGTFSVQQLAPGESGFSIFLPFPVKTTAAVPSIGVVGCNLGRGGGKVDRSALDRRAGEVHFNVGDPGLAMLSVMLCFQAEHSHG